MKPSEKLELHREAIREIVAKYRATNPRVFGSVARGEDTESSDLDLLIDPTDKTSLFDIGAILLYVSRLMDCKVDVLTPGCLPEQWAADALAQAKPV